MGIHPTRFLRSIDALAVIGRRPDGGVERLAFSPADKAGRDWVEARMRELGLEIHVDPIGNLLGIRAGREDGSIVLMGSHTDTVAAAGRFDGSLGVVAALEAVAALNDAGVVTECPIGVVSFMNEEGVRFMPDMMGSLYVTGQIDLDTARRIVGIDGTTIGENIDRNGFAGASDWRQRPIGAYLELHIEQGPVLEGEDRTIGVVEGVQGLTWLEVVFEGLSNHAGTTPMALRRDAGYAAGALTRSVREMAIDRGEPLRATVGSVHWKPNLINVIAREAAVTVDLRHPTSAALADAEARVEASAREIAAAEGLRIRIRRLVHAAPVRFDELLVGHVQAAADSHGFSSRRMLSGAGHDAQIMAARCPCAMVFVPSRGGVSHSPLEYTAPEHLVAGAEVLLGAALRAADVRTMRREKMNIIE
jgi:N-carbamoyl-L-amino-acid hydrolase